jgi:hypothetical protein
MLVLWLAAGVLAQAGESPPQPPVVLLDYGGADPPKRRGKSSIEIEADERERLLAVIEAAYDAQGQDPQAARVVEAASPVATVGPRGVSLDWAMAARDIRAIREAIAAWTPPVEDDDEDDIAALLMLA